MTIEKVYRRYEHLDRLLSDREFFAADDPRQVMLYDLWQAVKQEVENKDKKTTVG